MGERCDAVVVGSGPNGLSAAIVLAEAGRSVLVLEQAVRAGGGLRTEELLEPGFRHDVCATIMSLAPLTPAFESVRLDLVTPPAAIAHPFDDGTAALVTRSVDDTARRLGADALAYRRLVGPLAMGATDLFGMLLRPPRPPAHPLLLARFGLPGLLSARGLARRAFSGRDASALLAGCAAHSMLSLTEPITGAFGLVMLVSAHATGWPVAGGGSASVAAALLERLRSLGGKVACDRRVDSWDDMPAHRAAVLDLMPGAVARVAGERLPAGYRRRLQRYRHGPGAFKVDWTLDAPIPWRATDCRLAATVHLGGTMDEIATSEVDVSRGRHPDRPFVLLVQPTLFDPTRAPAGKHVAWAYCHVPNGSDVDMTRRLEDQVERFAPGFRDVVRARSTWTARRVGEEEPNCVGGDVNGGRMDLAQILGRPMLSLNPYATPDPSVFMCSAATPPGSGVHGMCGWNAAGAIMRSALR